MHESGDHTRRVVEAVRIVASAGKHDRRRRLRLLDGRVQLLRGKLRVLIQLVGKLAQIPRCRGQLGAPPVPPPVAAKPVEPETAKNETAEAAETPETAPDEKGTEKLVAHYSRRRGLVKELEHGLACIYLFAAYSLKNDVSEGGMTEEQAEMVRGWRRLPQPEWPPSEEEGHRLRQPCRFAEQSPLPL